MKNYRSFGSKVQELNIIQVKGNTTESKNIQILRQQLFSLKNYKVIFSKIKIMSSKTAEMYIK